MNFSKTYAYILGTVAVVLLSFVVVFFYIRSTSTNATTTSTTGFGTATDNSTNQNQTLPQNTTQQATSDTSSQSAAQKIFEISSDPVVGATFIQTLHPTTTLVRYISQNNGHVFDLPLDVSGAIPRVVSNITIPGGVRTVWVENGQGAILQYLDNTTVKTVYLGFPPQSATTTLPTKLHFLPDGIVDIAASPDQASVVYLLKTSSGVDGYVSVSSGINGKKLFSLPLSQMRVSWPSQGTILAQTNAATGVGGVAFSINSKSGAVNTLLYAQGLTAIADSSFSQIIYQTLAAGANAAATYVHTIKTNSDYRLSFDPSPEQCIWSKSVSTLLYCAIPMQATPLNYLDLWHEGIASVFNGIFSFDIATNKQALLATPGSNDGGVQTDILELSLSPDEHYLTYLAKGTRTLWGVRLVQ